jgi:GNAT superfamily N-acetyltransferase
LELKIKTIYKNKSDHSIKSELLVIVTEANNRSKGLGSKLVHHLNEEFKKENISEYTVTVHAEMEKSNNFYLRNGMNLLNSFELYDVVWNEYKNDIK